MTGDEKHSEAATSTLDVVWTLYDRVLRVDPDRLEDPDRDRFFLSKGHGPMAYYAVLAAKGFIDPAILAGFSTAESPLGHHPDRRRIPGVEISSGSLGQGLALGIGSALALGLSCSAGRVFVLMGDGELDEGSNHEAIAVAGRLGIGRLTAVVIDNQSSTLGWPGGIASRFAVEGWATRVVDGRNHDEIEHALTTTHIDGPLAVVAEVGRKR
ncbi:MAG: transketolase [Armatimonadetes bacterium]|nr:MAG: transketolase [Armatimonadota bacterium]